MTALETLGAFVAQVRSPAPGVRDLLHLHAIDSVGAWIAGLPTPEAALLRRWQSTQREGLAPGSMQRLRLDVATRCALARLSELDDIHLASTTTPGAIVVPGAVSIAATQRNSDPDVLAAAVLAGYEVMVRFGCAIGGASILYRGIWPTYFAAPLGMAATAARLLGLDAAQAAHALALALTRAAPGVGQHHAATASRWLAIGQAAEAGLMAALAARAGFTSDLALLDGGYLPGIYGVTPDIAVLTDQLGTRFAIAEVAFKPWCAARQTMASAQAMLELVASGIAAHSIIAVKAFVPPPHRRMVDHGVKPADRGSVLTSLPYQIALAALAPERMQGQGPSAPARIPADIEAFMGQVTVAPDEAMLAPFPSRWLARLEVTTPTGRHDRAITDVPGDPARPFDAAAVSAKFRRFADAAVGVATAAHLLDSTMRLFTERNAAAALVDALEAIVLRPAA